MKKIRSLIVGLIISLVSILFGLLFYEDSYITSITRYLDKKILTKHIEGPLVKNLALQGEFVAENNNLGIIKLKITTYNRINFDTIVFRIKEKGSRSWYATNKYITDVFKDGALYSFGFPVIHDSKGKIYQFELYSLSGTKNNSIGILHGYSSIASQYVYKREELLKNTEILLVFIREKILTSLLDINSYLYALIFLFPTIFYFIFHTFSYKISYILGIIVIFYSLLAYIYLPATMNSNIILYIYTMIYFVGSKIHLPSSKLFLLSFLLVLFIPINVYFRLNWLANRYATTVFFSLCLGTLFLIKENFIKSNK